MMYGMVTHAACIPCLLLGVDHFWINEDVEWPDWQWIFNQDLALLRDHPWWVHVAMEGPLEENLAVSLPLVLGKRKVKGIAEVEAEVRGVESQREPSKSVLGRRVVEDEVGNLREVVIKVEEINDIVTLNVQIPLLMAEVDQIIEV